MSLQPREHLQNEITLDFQKLSFSLKLNPIGAGGGLSTLVFSTSSYHNSTNIGPIGMFFTKN